MKHRTERGLAWMSDRLCALGITGEPTADGGYLIHPRKGIYRLTFEAGHLIGEIGWRPRMANKFMKVVRRKDGTTSAALRQGKDTADRPRAGLPAPACHPCRCGKSACRSGWPPDAPAPADLPDPIGWLRENGYLS